jgi:hypothetical protein
VVSANIIGQPSGEPMFLRQAVLVRGGVRVGVTGFTTPGVMVWDRNNVRGQAQVQRIGATAPAGCTPSAIGFVALIHSGMDGGSSYDSLGVGPENVAASLAAGPVRPDLVVVGHSHREMRDSVLNGVHFIQGKPYAQTLAVAHVNLVRDGAGWRVTAIRGDQIDLAGLEPPARFAARRGAGRVRIWNKRRSRWRQRFRAPTRRWRRFRSPVNDVQRRPGTDCRDGGLRTRRAAGGAFGCPAWPVYQTPSGIGSRPAFSADAPVLPGRPERSPPTPRSPATIST